MSENGVVVMGLILFLSTGEKTAGPSLWFGIILMSDRGGEVGGVFLKLLEYSLTGVNSLYW